MISFKTYITEMAPPREQDIVKEYYHGTDNEKAIQSIIKNGIQPPDLSTRKGFLKPREGKIYITPTLNYAIIYMLGANIVGDKYWDLDFIMSERYGYLCVIDGKDLKDIQPDEDSIGEMIHKKTPIWIYEKAKHWLAPSTMKKVMEGEYSYWAKAGKVLVTKLSDYEILQLIDAGAHIAHHGAIYPSQIWKFDKSLSKDLTPLCTNFWQLAERIK